MKSKFSYYLEFIGLVMFALIMSCKHDIVTSAKTANSATGYTKVNSTDTVYFYSDIFMLLNSHCGPGVIAMVLLTKEHHLLKEHLKIKTY